MNQRIVEWLKEGKYYEVLSGVGAHFVEDPTYRGSHDLILIISTMTRWAYETKQIDSCAKGFKDAVTNIIKESPIKALDIINSYLIVSSEIKLTLPINIEQLYPLIEQELTSEENYSNDEKKQINTLMSAIGKKLIVFKKWKGKGL